MSGMTSSDEPAISHSIGSGAADLYPAAAGASGGRRRQRESVTHLVRRAVFWCGVASLILSAFSFSAGTVPAMRTGLPALFHAVMMATAGDPAPSPTPAPRRRRRLLGDGAVLISGRGGFDLGSRRSSQNATAQSSAQYGGALTVDLQRRTERTSLLVTQALGYTGGLANLSQVQVGYRTPDYALDYGLVTGPQQTQISIGGFARGVRVTKPRPDGAFELLAAAAVGSGGQGFTALGGRYVRQTRASELAFTALRASAQHARASNGIGAVDYHRFTPHGTIVLEAALSEPRGFDDLADGAHVAFGLSDQMTAPWGFGELRLLDAPSGFASLNTVTYPTKEMSATLRREFGRTTVGLTADVRSLTDPTGPDLTRRGTIDLTRGWAYGSAAVTASVTTESVLGARSVNRDLGLVLGQTIGAATSLSETAQTATASTDTGSSRSNGLSVAASRRIGAGFVQVTLGANASSGAGLDTRTTDALLAYTRPVGRRIDVTTSLERSRTTQGPIASTLSSVTAGVIARLSPALSLRVAGSQNVATGATASRGSTLQIDLIGPVGFGSTALSGGRGDPRLPATIRGHVFVAGGGDVVTAAAAQQRGYGNVVVVLDNNRTQRTDAAGEFNFAFVKAGVHTIGIESASLPPGFIVDRRSETVRVEGGRVAGVDFAIGRFAGVGGRVYAAAPSGIIGFPGIVVAVDGLVRTSTDAQGRWSIGRLTPGSHRVTLSADALPTNVAIDGPVEKTVQVVDGTVTPVDFVAVALGSVSGHVVAVDPNDPTIAKGIADVYVVAQPGEHAAITDATGAFLLDNLPAGDYTLDVDKDSLPDGAGGLETRPAVRLAPSQHVEDLVLALGREEKGVVFTFKGGKTSPLTLAFDPPRAPPGALVTVTAQTDGTVGAAVAIESDLFKGRIALKRDGPNGWKTAFVLPLQVHGDIAVEAIAGAAHASSTIDVDPALPLIAVRTVPAHPAAGKPFHLSIKTYAPLAEGDVLRFDDGQTLRLPKPHGRTFELDARMPPHALPYGGTIASGGRSLVLVVR